MLTDIVYPMTPYEAIRKYPKMLTLLEIEEITHVPLVYYLGEKSVDNTGCILGTFFEENGEFSPYLNAQIRYRYQILEFMLKGAFANVVRAFDHKIKCEVAITLLKNKALNYINFKNEMKILNALLHFSECKGKAVNVLDRFTFRYANCFVFEMMACNLVNLLELTPQGLPVGDICRIIKDICATLKMFHKKHIFQLNVKPENVAVRERGTMLALMDFGLSANRYSSRHFRCIPTLGYQAPETILGGPITGAVDMWALGCMVAELFTGKMLFRDESEDHQFASIVELLGMPPAPFLEKCDMDKIPKFINSDSGRPLYCDPITVDAKQEDTTKCSKELNLSIGPPKSRSFPCRILECGKGLVLNFVKRCLSWDPKDRITASQATKHPLLKVCEVSSSQKEEGLDTLGLYLIYKPNLRLS